MSEWMQSLAAYLLITSLVMQLLPGTKYEGYVRLFTGLLLILLVIQPILKIGSADRYVEEKVQSFFQEQETLEAELMEKSAVFFQDSAAVESDAVEEVFVEKIENVEVRVTIND